MTETSALHQARERAEMAEKEVERLREHLREFMSALASIGHECRQATSEDDPADPIQMEEILCRVADAVNGMSYECSVLSSTDQQLQSTEGGRG